MPVEKGKLDGESADIKRRGKRLDIFPPSLKDPDHGHIVTNDGVNADYVRLDGNQVIVDRRERDPYRPYHREQQNRERRERKEELIRKAEALTDATDFRSGHARAQDLRSQWKAIGSAGRHNEQELWPRFNAALDRFYERRKADRDKRDQARKAAEQKKSSLVSRAKMLSSSSDWKSAGEEFRRLMDEWKKAGPAGKETDDRLWREFSGARDNFRKRRETHFSNLEKERERNRYEKERIVSEAQRAAGSNDLRSGRETMRSLMDRWKKIKSAGKEHDERLWRAFSQARDQLHRRGEEQRQNAARRKDALVAEASSVATSVDLREAGARWKSIMQRWKEAGRADRATEDALWNRLQGWRRQLDIRYEQAKRERQQRAYERIRRLEEVVARKRATIANFDSRIAEVQSRPPIRSGPRQWEIAAKRNAKIGDLRMKRDSVMRSLMEIESKLREARSRA